MNYKHVWSIILPGHENPTLTSQIRDWFGHPLPKQFCSFMGTRSMFQHTVDRADRITFPEQKVAVVDQDQRHMTWQQMGRRTGRIIVQPDRRHSAATVFFPLTYIRVWDPKGIVVLYPADHFIHPEPEFAKITNRALVAAELLNDSVVLLGALSEGSNPMYGRIYPGEGVGWPGGDRMHRVHALFERTDPQKESGTHADTWLTNTMIVVTKQETLWKLCRIHLPELHYLFERLAESIGTSREGKVLDWIYHRMPALDFSKDLLVRAIDRLTVMSLQNIYWNDWGTPGRILKTIQEFGKHPAFARQPLAAT